ncbi:MAG TPA: aminotransferase class III-fold pyridoxal phosphate-dependent enzyme [Bryobacteraceae bacterium]|nr:aminotransferase class III-fold pyridoxal phosphate-dependent enzyme [Bryobacteraceae bacterium]
MLLDAPQSSGITPSQAQLVAKQLYGLDVTAAALPGELDENFHLISRDQTEYVLKIMRPDCDLELLELQGRALKHLAAFPVPRVVGSIAIAAEGRLVWMLSWLPGRPLAQLKLHSPDLLFSLGRLLGRMDGALQNFSHPAARRDLKWDLTRASWIRGYLHYIPDPARRRLVERILARYEAETIPLIPTLRHSVIHGDANDYNVLVHKGDPALIDFGDLHYSVTVAELAVACAYASFGESDPLGAIRHVVRGYHESNPLSAGEFEALFPLILTRLAVSVANSAHRKTLSPHDPYITISEEPAWAAIEKLSAVHPHLALYALRGSGPSVAIPAARKPSQLLGGIDLASATVFDLSAGSLMLGADPGNQQTPKLTETLFAAMREAGTKVGIGRYNEARLLYTAPFFASGPHPTDERRTIHLGLDLFAEPGTPVCAPIAGAVHAYRVNARRQDYGPVVILRHEDANGQMFFTLYGHLSIDSLEDLGIDQPIGAGERIGTIGVPEENGDWPPHLHFQIITDLLDLDTDFPGVAFASQRELWLSLSPDPNLIAGIPQENFPAPEPSKAETLDARRGHLGRNLSISYADPLKIVRGWRQYLYDETGRAFLDVYNNVPLVGHSHPRVVEAVQRQVALLNTNTRYLHDTITRYAGRLTALFPEPLRVCYFLNSASEANELALRIARAHTGREEVVVLEHAYHGNTTTLIDISPYKFDGPGGRGRKPWVHVAPIPEPGAGHEYADRAGKIVHQVKPAAFIAESLPSVAGQIVLPPGYLTETYRYVRSAGGICIADEVQVGFGRLGRWFWGFEMQDVIPDIVVLGKPMGNGFPLAGVVTTPEIAASFDNGMEFFSTYGGNPVACAAGAAVLDVLEDEGLQENAMIVGDHLLHALRRLDHPLIEDVRGIGLFLGVELTPGPAPSHIVNRLRERGILTGVDGPHHNVIKIRPPLIFTKEDADFFVRLLGEVLQEDLV